jgi:tetratricopeptide (TPR) repeat protein
MAGVFLSYRRNDSAGWAGRIHDSLVLRYGADGVWQDVDDLTVGSDYLPQILDNIAEADAVLIVIGPHWLDERAPDGTPRLAEPSDVLRTEIAHALKRKSGVIPTLVGGAKMPDAKDLPRNIAPLVKRNGIAIFDADWASSMQRLFQKLQALSRTSRAATLDEILAQLETLQTHYFNRLGSDPQSAALTAGQAIRLLNEQMPRFPDVQRLQLSRGFFLKHLAVAQHDMGDMAGFESHIALAAKCFEIVEREAKLYLADAYSGSATIPYFRGDLTKALDFLDSALELVPDHPSAKLGREGIRGVLKA